MVDSTANGSWLVDVDVPQKVYRAFVKTGVESAKENDDSLLYPYFAQFIKAWPYSLDPAIPESYDELKRSEFTEVVKRVMAAFQQVASALSG